MPSTVRQQQPRSFRAWLKLGLMFSIIASSILTLALGGFVRPQTIQVVSASNYVSSLYGEFSFRTTFGYDEDFSGWSIGHKSASATASIEASPNLLSVDGSFLNYSKPASVAVSKRTSVNITSAPILSTRVNVTGSVLYGLRFFGQYSNGTEFDVWWESSFLDHRPAMGYETIRLNMERQAFLATGRTVQVLTRFELYVEARPNTVADFRLELFELSFLNEETGPLGNQEGYKAVYIELDPKPSGPAAWYLNKFQLGARIVAIPCTTFTLHLIDGAALYTSIDSPSRYAYSPLTPSYNFAFYPEVSSKTFSELLPRSEFSIVLVANAGYFTDLTLNYLDFFFFPSPDSVVDLERSTLGLYYSYFVFFLFLLPVGLSVLVYREFFTRQSAGRRAVALVVTAGLVCRLALAPITAHVFDMNAFLASTRGWFQYGTPRGALGPTQPLTFFLYWIPYSFYALAQSVGFQDVFLPAHDAGMLEAVFVKLFPMIGDVFLFVLLLRFSPGGKMFVWASFYFLNPLAILTSSVRGHYDTATMALIVAGVFFMKNQKIARGSVSFLAAGMVQLLGFIPFTLSLLQLFWTRRYKLGLGLASAAASVVLSYPPQRDLMYRLVLAISGLTASQQFTPLGRFTLLGSIPSLIFISSFHPLLVVGGLVLFRVSLTTFRGRLHVDSLLLYTILSYVAFLLLLDLPNRWYWVLPLGIVYAILKGKDSLAAYMLVFGTAASFFIVSNATGSAYYLVGQVGDPALMQPLIEGIRNGLTVFVVMVTTLTGLFLAYLCRRSDGDAGGTLARSSLIVFGVYLMAYFWVSVYPI